MNELAKLQQLPSYNWSLEMVANIDGLQLILEWAECEPQYKHPGFSWILFSFVYPASWAHLDYSQMWQHVPESPKSTVLRMEPHLSNKTHVREITLNTESHSTGWANYQIVACDDVVNVIGREPPSIRLYESRPKMLEWWSQGQPVI